MNGKVNIIVVPQEFEKANHKDLWLEMDKNSKHPTIIINIGSDIPVTLYKRRFFRLKESIVGSKKIGEKLYLLRPHYLLRPEIGINFINNINAKLLKRYLKRIFKNIEDIQFNVLVYSGRVIEFFNKMNLKTNYYYFILDEVRRIAHTDEINQNNVYYDELACENSEYIFLMSKGLKKNRNNYISKIKVIGNGAHQVIEQHEVTKLKKSVGLIGNIRNWIDLELLEGLIKKRDDLNFGIVGNIEIDMKEYIGGLLKEYKNINYFGEKNKEEIYQWYKKFDVLIVPYKQNKFMRATRPIKIIESIFAGTPVVTIPVEGYKENEFIRFATNVKEFSDSIDYFMSNHIDTNSTAYKRFVEQNSWSNKAKEILESYV